MRKSKKIIILFCFIISPIFLWCETNFYWDIGIGSIDAKTNKDFFESDLSLSIGNLYLEEEKTNLIFSFETLLCYFPIVSKNTAYPDIPQRDLKSLFLINPKILWNPIKDDCIWFGPYISVNYLNPFNISEFVFSSGLELSLLAPLNSISSFGDYYLPKLFSLETGFSLSNNEKFQHYFYGKFVVNAGIVFALLANIN